MDKIRIYFSHPIRGAKGLDATRADMEANNAKSLLEGRRLQSRLDAYAPGEFEVYIPAEHEEIIQYLYDVGYLNEAQILEADCAIVQKCKLLVGYDLENVITSGMSRGITKEMDCAALHGIPIKVIPRVIGGDQIEEIMRLARGQ